MQCVAAKNPICLRKYLLISFCKVNFKYFCIQIHFLDFIQLYKNMQKAVLLLFLTSLILFAGRTYAQEVASSKWRISGGVGQYSAKIGLPDMKVLHPGLLLGASYQYNSNSHHQLRQAAYLGAFYHEHFQTAVQLYTEFHYEWHVGQRLFIAPMALGGGYVASFSNMASHKWDGEKYIAQKISLKNNFMISLGPSLAYKSPWKLAANPVSFIFGYRLQVQGVIVRNTVPLIVYSSWQIGVGMPLN